MKKTLLLGTLAIFGLMANAQLVTEVTSESLEAAGIGSDKIDLPGALVFGDGPAGTIATAYSDQWGSTNPCGDYRYVKVNSVEVDLATGGAVGASNPTFESYADGAPSAGAVFAITPSQDGWLTIFTKMSGNKEYVVFEGKTSPMSYTLGYSNSTATFSYTIPYDPETYYIDFDSPEIDKYVNEAQTKPLTPQLTAGLEANPGNATAFLTFNVLGGNTYYFSALGSKAPCGTFVLTEGDAEPTVTFLADADKGLPEVVFKDGEAGVESIAVAPVDENAPVYNVMGQKVNDDYKGIVIKNGKKFIRR